MSNLLDSASIVLTPTAYDNGKMLSVKPIPVYGAELVNSWTNKDFSAFTSSGSTITQMVSSGSGNNCYSLATFESGKTYKIEFTSSQNITAQIRISNNDSLTGAQVVFSNPVSNLNSVTFTANANYSYIGFYAPVSFTDTQINGFFVKEVLVADGDFDFSRNSAATRVNAQGLVENVQILSGDLVSNGDFSQEGVQEVSNGSFSQEGAEQVTNGDFATDTDWAKGTGWTISGGSANCDGVSGISNLSQVITSFIGKTFLVEGNASNVSQGFVYISLGGTDLQISVNSSGSFKHYVTISSGNSTLFISARNNFIGSIDNVSVKEVGQDWSLGTGWSIGEDKAIFDDTTTNRISQTGLSIISGKSYKIDFTIADCPTTAHMTIYDAGGSDLILPNENYVNGSYTRYYTATTNETGVSFWGNTAGDTFSVTNISVKEVGQDWTLGTGWSIGEDKAVATSGTGASMASSIQNTSIGRKFKFTFQAVVDSGIANAQLYGITIPIFSTSGFKEYIITSTSVSGFSFYKAADFNGSITNISVIEITDDTNLPRINYEGFSYQDSLGSEEVVNGAFDVNVNGWTTNNANATFVWQSDKTALLTSTSFAYARVSPSLNLNASVYKVSFDVLSFEGTLLNVHIGLGSTGNIITTTGSYTYFYTSTGGSTEFQIRPNSGGTGSIKIDNVSVKEYLGQEVVPDSGCGSWLLEPQSTNIQRYSTTLSTNWLVTGTGVVTYNNAISPDGTNNATYFSAPASSSKGLYNQLSLSTSTYTASVWAKSKGLGNDKFQLGNGSGTGIGGVGEFTATSEWQRFEKTGTTVSGSRPVGVFQPIDSSAMDILFWGYQYEQQSYATSYIPTNGATSTRLQDIANNSGNATLINSTEGVLYAEIAALADDLTFRQISLSDGTNQNRVVIRYRTSSNRINFLLSAGGSTILNQTPPVSDITDMHKVAISYKSGDIRLYIDGVKLAPSSQSSSPFTISGLDDLSFNGAANVDSFYGKTKAVVVYKEALTDEQLTCLTTI